MKTKCNQSTTPNNSFLISAHKCDMMLKGKLYHSLFISRVALVLLFSPTFVLPFQHRLFSYSSYCPFVQPLYHDKLRIFGYKIKSMYTKCINLSKNKLLYVYVNINTCMFAPRACTISILLFTNMKVLF